MLAHQLARDSAGGRRARALAQVARCQATAGCQDVAFQILREAASAARFDEDVFGLCDVARVLTETGQDAAAHETLRAALTMAREKPAPVRESQISTVAEQFAVLGDVDGADAAVQDLPDDDGSIAAAILDAHAVWLAKARRFGDAVAAAYRITDDSNRASALSEIAGEQAKAGAFDDAISTAHEIAEDQTLARSFALWDIVAELAKAGRLNEASALKDVIPESWALVRALADIGAAHVKAGDEMQADAAFRSALERARSIDEAWALSGALAGIADALARSGRRNDAVTLLHELRDTARGDAVTLTQVVQVLARASCFEDALEVAESIETPESRADALAHIAAAMSTAAGARPEANGEARAGYDSAPSTGAEPFASSQWESPRAEHEPGEEHEDEQTQRHSQTAPNFPARMRELVREVRAIVDSARQGLTASSQRYQQAISEINGRREAGIALNQRDFETACAAAEKLKQELNRLMKAACDHLTAQHVAVPQRMEPEEPLADPVHGSTTAAQALAQATGRLKAVQHAVKEQLLRTLRPKDVVRPNGDDTFGVLVAVALIAGGFIGLQFKSVPAFWLVAALVYAGVMIVVNVSPLGNLRTYYEAADEAAREAELLLRRYLRLITAQRDAGLEAMKRFDSEAEAALRAFHADCAALDEALRPKDARVRAAVASFEAELGFGASPWSSPAWERWTPATSHAFAVRVGALAIATEDLSPYLQSLPSRYEVPAVAPFPDSNLMFEAAGKAKDLSARAVQSLLARLLATIPAGKLRFTLIDPVGLGSNVASLMRLADFEESLVTSRAWSEPPHIEHRLGDVAEHMQTVIQKYLRADYRTIQDYNEAAGEIAEPYRVVVVFDFPVNFTETAARHLVSIARNGARCGVHTVVVCDTSKPLPYGFVLADLERSVIVVARPDKAASELRWNDRDYGTWSLKLDEPPPSAVWQRLNDTIGERAKDAMRVEVPYDKLLDLAHLHRESWWTGRTARSIRVPLGRTGARSIQYLTLGEAMGHHALIVGRPGSGKSNLMHVIITTLALAYSPSEVRLYLIDFKKGVEFKPYAEHRLPHAEAIAIESDREFGLSVIERLNVELKRRGDLFRAAGTASIGEYREATGAQLARVLLIVDEFQEFFTQDDRLAREAALLLDRLVRQGRAFGLHVMLGSQTLAGSYNLARSTLDQMAIRIAMQCSEADSRLILADDNDAARLLSRPGEAIYNAASGLFEGNMLFQIARMTDEDRTRALVRVSNVAHASGATMPVPIVFEGNELAPIEACRKLTELLGAAGWPVQKATDVLLGDPIAISDPVTARLRRQSGSNVLMLVREESEAIGMCVSAIVSVLAQHAPDTARIVVADFSQADGGWPERADEIASLFPHDVRVVRRQRELAETVRAIHEEVQRRFETADRSSIFLMLQGMHRMRVLREEDDSFAYDDERRTPSELFAAILREGPEVGVHVIGWCDTYPNAARIAGRRTMVEFALRAGGVMSADDSMSFFDDAAASRIDKQHRMIFFDEASPGRLDKFRPYSMPSRAWLEDAARRLHARGDRG
ncbi:MAG: segregation ATPase, FtsK/SpoIIIE family [Candidatus Eremiobacteraeota bacterium]|nr:segregation ATPase, FtsK/SpoIIIE family [Candidatus Eremiobacteraeota bacterium]